MHPTLSPHLFLENKDDLEILNFQRSILTKTSVWNVIIHYDILNFAKLSWRNK